MAVRVIVAGAGLVSLGAGVWALLDPISFYTRLGTFPPYNEHFIHDIGAFELGLGMALWIALFWSDALLVVLAANAIGATFHWLAHLVDRNLGGHPTTDLPFFLVLAAALWVATLLRLRQLRTSGP